MSESELVIDRLPFDDTVNLATTLLKLNEQSSRPSPFFTPEYMATYLACNERYAPAETQPFVLLARRRVDREVVAALPLKRVWDRSQKIPFHRIEFLVSTEIDLPPLLAVAEYQLLAARAMLRALSFLLHRASVIELINQSADSPLYRARDAARAPWADVRDSASMPISFIGMNYPDLSAYFRALNKKMRSNVSRLARRLCAEGRLEYLTASDPQVSLDLFRIYLDVERRSWKRGTDASLFRHPARVQMYETLLRRSGAVRYHIDILLLDEVPIAAQVSMHYGKTLFAMETCYDERYGAMGPGNLMLFLAVARSIRLGVCEMSLHGHFDYYKHRWLGETVETRDLRILRKGSFPHLRAVAGAALRRLSGRREREVGVPVGQADLAETNQLPVPPPACADTVARVRRHPAVTNLDHQMLLAELPFPPIVR